MKSRITCIVILLLAFSVCLSGCKAFDKGRAAKSGWQEKRFLELKAKYVEQQPLANIIDEIADQQERNDMIIEIGYLIDYQFEEFANGLNSGRTFFNTASDITVISLTTASTLFGAESTKSILSGLATIVEGGQTSIDKHYFQKQTMAALASQMRANRDKAWSSIATNMTKPLGDYSAQQALSELIEYYNAGSLLRALESVEKETAANKKKATEERKANVTVAFNTDADAKSTQQNFSEWLQSDPANHNLLEAWLNTKKEEFDIEITIPSVWIYNATLTQLEEAKKYIKEETGQSIDQ